ncbi:SDR family NAD(P)-dependent oxidoreductase [Paenarthrobacter nicotinovorans]|uniref:SDR family NAD(P)-dependent oxidoreductase n=1 Tax=Paenarthrobacter nicotinovorans TaxID=29320 RepID=UPI0037FC8F20
MPELFDLSGMSAIVTGSSRGIGFAIAQTLLNQGASVVVNGFSSEETDNAVSRLTTESDEARVVAAAGDVTDQTAVEEIIETALATFGSLDHVICNAGIDIIKPAIDYTPDEWDRVITVNLRGAFQISQTAARHWIANGLPGSVTVTSSVAGSVGIPTLAPYAASKGGVNQMVRTLAAEWAPHHIRVNAVAPGYVANIMDNVLAHEDPASDRRIQAFTPLGRRANLDEIAGPFAFLASRAATYVTGAIIAVDGGYTAV